jgi:hypothetical protein
VLPCRGQLLHDPLNLRQHKIPPQIPRDRSGETPRPELWDE